MPTSTELTSDQIRSLILRPRLEQIKGRSLANVLQDAVTVDDVALLLRFKNVCENVHRDEVETATRARDIDVLGRRIESVLSDDARGHASAVVERDNTFWSSKHIAAHQPRDLRTFSVAHSRVKTASERFSEVVNLKLKDTTIAVLAAQNHAIKVMKFLLQESRETINLEKEGTARFEGEERISGATPLWTSSALGSLDMVQLLVDAGAKVNHASATNSTPLRAACYDGFVDVVRYLANAGGDVNIRNRFGSGPLHLAAYRGYPEIVAFLLERGANPDVRTSTDREVPLHHAAMMGHADVTRILIGHGADTSLLSGHDVTPLTCAAVSGEQGVMEELLLSKAPPVTRREKARALLLLGAAFIERHQSQSKAQSIWTEAMELGGDAGMAFPDGELPCCPVYGNVQFARTPAELHHIIVDDWTSFNLASAIREHILGGSNPETIHYLRCRGAMEADAKRYGNAMRLWLHCLQLEMDSEKKGTHPEVTSTLAACTELLVEQIRAEGDADVKAVFEVVWSNIHRHPLGGIECGKTVRILLTLLYIWNKLSVSVPRQASPCRDCARRLVHQRFVLNKGYNNYTPLHLACDKKTFVSGAKSRKNVCLFPSPPLLKLLLECGGIPLVVERDSRGNTPLHTAAASASMGCVRELLFYLSPANASLQNSAGARPVAVATSDKIRAVLNEFLLRAVDPAED